MRWYQPIWRYDSINNIHNRACARLSTIYFIPMQFISSFQCSQVLSLLQIYFHYFQLYFYWRFLVSARENVSQNVEWNDCQVYNLTHIQCMFVRLYLLAYKLIKLCSFIHSLSSIERLNTKRTINSKIKGTLTEGVYTPFRSYILF